MDILNSVIAFLANYSAIVVLLVVFIYLIVVISYFHKQNREKKMKDIVDSEYEAIIQEEEFKKKEVKETIPMLDIEKFAYEAIGISKNKAAIMMVRIAAVAAIICLGFAMRVLAIFIAFEVIMILRTKVEDKKIEDEIGISRTQIINKFLDFYIPSVQSGISVRQTMQNFIASNGDEDLVEWFYSTDPNKKIPRQWEEIINVYENGISSEEAGMTDKAEYYQEEIDRLMGYFNNYKAKIGEVNPICSCYYIGVPVVAYMSYSNFTDLWSGFVGVLMVAALCILFFAFNRLVQKTKKDCVNKVF